MKILFLTKHSKQGASSRYRTLQYIPYLISNGIECHISPLFDEQYLANRYNKGKGRPFDLMRAIARRLIALSKAKKFDLIVIEKEILPYSPSVLEHLLNLLNIPYVVDYDDALFHQYDAHTNPWIRKLLSKKIARVMRRSKLVIAGNAYISNYASLAGSPSVEIVPTVIDIDRYHPPSNQQPPYKIFTIGWIGSPSTAKYLNAIAPALAEVCAGGKGQVQLIGSGPFEIPGVPIDILPWSETTEVKNIHNFDVGIMPLPDTPWERGKCGFKLIQYMGCALPVVASPVGINTEIVEPNINGFLAHNHQEWVNALTQLRDDPEMRHRLGRSGLEKAKQKYSLQATQKTITELLTSTKPLKK